jgi:hypothetical protein
MASKNTIKYIGPRVFIGFLGHPELNSLVPSLEIILNKKNEKGNHLWDSGGKTFFEKKNFTFCLHGNSNELEMEKDVILLNFSGHGADSSSNIAGVELCEFADQNAVFPVVLPNTKTRLKTSLDKEDDWVISTNWFIVVCVPMQGVKCDISNKGNCRNKTAEKDWLTYKGTFQTNFCLLINEMLNSIQAMHCDFNGDGFTEKNKPKNNKGLKQASLSPSVLLISNASKNTEDYNSEENYRGFLDLFGVEDFQISDSFRTPLDYHLNDGFTRVHLKLPDSKHRWVEISQEINLKNENIELVIDWEGLKSGEKPCEFAKEEDSESIVRKKLIRNTFGYEPSPSVELEETDINHAFQKLMQQLK